MMSSLFRKGWTRMMLWRWHFPQKWGDEGMASCGMQSGYLKWGCETGEGQKIVAVEQLVVLV